MASFTCHMGCGTKRGRLERIVRPRLGRSQMHVPLKITALSPLPQKDLTIPSWNSVT